MEKVSFLKNQKKEIEEAINHYSGSLRRRHSRTQQQNVVNYKYANKTRRVNNIYQKTRGNFSPGNRSSDLLAEARNRPRRNQHLRNPDYLSSHSASSYRNHEEAPFNYGFEHPVFNSLQSQPVEENSKQAYQSTMLNNNPFLGEYTSATAQHQELPLDQEQQPASSFSQEKPRPNVGNMNEYSENGLQKNYAEEYNQQKSERHQVWSYANECLANSTGMYTQVVLGGLVSLPQNKGQEPVRSAEIIKPENFKVPFGIQDLVKAFINVESSL